MIVEAVPIGKLSPPDQADDLRRLFKLRSSRTGGTMPQAKGFKTFERNPLSLVLFAGSRPVLPWNEHGDRIRPDGVRLFTFAQKKRSDRGFSPSGILRRWIEEVGHHVEPVERAALRRELQ